MIADDRESQIAESSAIVCDHMETHFCDRLRSSAILRSYGIQSSAICDRNVSHNNLILTQMIQHFLATKPECSFMFVTVLSETRSSLSSVWKAPSFVSSWIFFELKTDVFFDFEADDAVASGLKEEVNLLAAKFSPRCPLFWVLRFCREHNARVHLTFLLTEMYGCSRLCDRLRSSAIIWKQLSLRSSAICDLRSAIVCDHMETSL